MAWTRMNNILMFGLVGIIGSQLYEVFNYDFEAYSVGYILGMSITVCMLLLDPDFK